MITDEFKAGLINFSNYEEYKLFVIEEWETDAGQNLWADDLIIQESITKSEDGTEQVNYRQLTEEEFNQKYPKV